MPGNPLVRFDEGRVGRTARCRPLSYSTVIIFFQPVHDSCDAVFNEHDVKVDQQAKPLVGEPKIGQKLLLVDREKQLDGFDFHDDFLFDHQISPESGVNADVLIDHRNR